MIDILHSIFWLQTQFEYNYIINGLMSKYCMQNIVNMLHATIWLQHSFIFCIQYSNWKPKLNAKTLVVKILKAKFDTIDVTTTFWNQLSQFFQFYHVQTWLLQSCMQQCLTYISTHNFKCLTNWLSCVLSSAEHMYTSDYQIHWPIVDAAYAL